MHLLKSDRRYGLYYISSGPLPAFTTSPGWQGQLSRATVKDILDQLTGVRTRSLRWRVRFDHEPLALMLNSLGLFCHDRKRMQVLELDRDHSRVFARYNATIRNHVRKGRKRGVSTRSTSNLDDILAYQAIYSKHAEENNWLFVYPTQLTLDLTKLAGITCFKVAQYQDRIVGGALFVRDGNSVIYLMGMTDRDYNHLFPSCAVLDAGIQWACEIGADFFNFGGSGNNEKLAKFKSFWGTRVEQNWGFEWRHPIWGPEIRSRLKKYTFSVLRKSSKKEAAH